MKQLKKLELHEMKELDDKQLKDIFAGEKYTVVTCKLNENGTGCYEYDEDDVRCEESVVNLPGGYQLISWGACKFVLEQSGSSYHVDCLCEKK